MQNVDASVSYLTCKAFKVPINYKNINIVIRCFSAFDIRNLNYWNDMIRKLSMLSRLQKKKSSINFLA